jgi:hypothetical protein
VSFFSAGTRWAPMLGGYPKSSDGSPNTRERERERVLSAFEHTIRM